MSQAEIALWLDDWVHFAGMTDFVLAIIGIVLGVLLLVWFSQQSHYWYAIFAGTLVISMLLNVATFSLFVVPPHRAGCTNLCLGRIGYPLPFATISPSAAVRVYAIDFALNLLLIWLVWCSGMILWHIVSEAVALNQRSFRFRLLFFLTFLLLTWGLLPRYFRPPEAQVVGEELRLSINARRAAETIYNVTGLWVHRLALEDIHYIPVEVPNILGGIDQSQAQVCLRGYTYFYLPWRRYRVTLDPTGVISLNIQELPLSESCWQS